MSIEQLAAHQERGRRSAKSLLPSDPPAPGASRAELYAWLTVALALGDDPVAGIKRFGHHDEGRLVISLRSGTRIVYERQADVLNSEALVRRVVLSTAADTPAYGKPDAGRIARIIIRAADVIDKDDERVTTRDWARTFLETAHHLAEAHDMATAAGRYAALCALRDFQPRDADPRLPAAHRAAVMHDTDARAYLRVSAFGAHVRGIEKRPIGWPTLHGLLGEIGWLGPYELEQRQPRGDKKVKIHVYVVPAGWEDA